MKVSKHWEEKADGTRQDIHYWFCPGCESPHAFDGRWTFNGDYDKPTFRASYLARSLKVPGTDEYKRVCHSFVTDGMIQFLEDSTHALAGQTVEMPELPDWLS